MVPLPPPVLAPPLAIADALTVAEAGATVETVLLVVLDEEEDAGADLLLEVLLVAA